MIEDVELRVAEPDGGVDQSGSVGSSTTSPVYSRTERRLEIASSTRMEHSFLYVRTTAFVLRGRANFPKSRLSRIERRPIASGAPGRDVVDREMRGV